MRLRFDMLPCELQLLRGDKALGLWESDTLIERPECGNERDSDNDAPD